MRERKLRRLWANWQKFRFSTTTEKFFVGYTAKCELEIEELIRSKLNFFLNNS
jgi:hypothetical protein